MEPRIHVVTLAVDDVDCSLAFYRTLGLESSGVIGTEFERTASQAGGAVAMFDLDGGLILSLYSRQDLALDAGIAIAPTGASGFSIGHLVAERAQVDAVLDQARAAGATMLAAAHERPWGIYSGYFRDPDGHLWEVAWNQAVDAPEA